MRPKLVDSRLLKPKVEYKYDLGVVMPDIPDVPVPSTNFIVNVFFIMVLILFGGWIYEIYRNREYMCNVDLPERKSIFDEQLLNELREPLAQNMIEIPKDWSTI